MELSTCGGAINARGLTHMITLASQAHRKLQALNGNSGVIYNPLQVLPAKD